MAFSVGDKLGHYEVLSLLGAGGMGEVYRAKDTKLKRDVALKVLPEAFARDPERMARFQREAEVLASLNHPNIAAIYGVEDCALIMELVEGESPKGPLSFDDAWKIGSQIAEALEYAHDRGIVHRDLKPANVKIAPDGTVKLLDFGLAKAFTSQKDTSPGSNENSPTLTIGATEVGVILGTAAYMSPEQARGKQVDKRADIWAFGVLMYEFLTGKRPFKGEDVSETLASVIKDEPGWTRVPEKAQRLLRSCLEKDPKKRLRDIGDACQLLQEQPHSGSIRHRKLPWMVAALTTVVAVGALWALWRAVPIATIVLRYTIPPPVNASFSSFAISPDGHSLAVAARTGDKQSLWVRDLTSLQYRALVGTEGAYGPFWSPDSRSIGFFAAQSIKRVPVSGGPVQTLVKLNSEISSGGSWNRAGQILHQESPTGGIGSVQASGGSETLLIAGKEPLFWPAWLPDGRRFLYSSIFGPDDQRGLYLASPGSKDARRLLPDASNGTYTPPGAGNRNGYLLFVREGALMVQPVDKETLRSIGDPVAIAEQLASGLGFAANIVGANDYSVSGNGTLVYQVGGGEAAADRRLTWFDRTGANLGSTGKPGAIVDFTLSPDGHRLAVSRQGSQGTDLWVEDLERGTSSRFTSDSSFNRQPVWAPDGSRIVFSSSRSGRTELYQKLTNGATQEAVFYEGSGDGGGAKYASDWSRDGKFVLFTNIRGVFAVPLENRKPVALVQTGRHAQLSPDRRWMAYSSTESGSPEIYVQPFPLGATNPVSGKWTISTAGGSSPRWRGDGKELFYLAADGKIMSVEVQAGDGTKFRSGTPQRLFDLPPLASQLRTYVFRYAVTADGKRFLVLTDSENTPQTPLTVVINWQASLKTDRENESLPAP